MRSGGTPNLATTAVPVQIAVVHGVDQGHPLVHQLRQILVAGGDQRPHSLAAGLSGQGPDDIVCLHIRHHQQRQAHGPDPAVQGFDLLTQVVRHRRPIGLVLVVEIVAKGLARGVEHHPDVGRPMLVDQTPQHIDNADQGTGGLALGVGQRRQGMIGAKQVRGAVYQDEQVVSGHGWGPGAGKRQGL